MALKKAIVQFTNENGDRLTRHMSIRAVVFDYDQAMLQIHFQSWPSEAARQAGAKPNFLQQNLPIDLTSPSDGPMISQISDVIWDKIMSAPFMVDFSDTDEQGQMKPTMKTLTQLGAEIVEVSDEELAAMVSKSVDNLKAVKTATNAAVKQ